MADFTTKKWGKQQIDLRHLGNRVVEFKPTEFHLKSDGALDGGPSLVVVMDGPVMAACGQISIKMLSDALAELGYGLYKKLDDGK